MDDTAATRAKAYKHEREISTCAASAGFWPQAMDQARDRASHLATLASVKLGPVLAIQEPAVPSTGTVMDAQQMQTIMAMYGMDSKSDSRATSDRLGDITVRVTLQVRFGIDK